MAQALIDEDRLKEILKKALIELFEERKDLFYDLVAEVVEDIALARAIKEGETTESVSRAEVFKILEYVNKFHLSSRSPVTSRRRGKASCSQRTVI